MGVWKPLYELLYCCELESKESWCEDAALFDSMANLKRITCFTTYRHAASHPILELYDQVYQVDLLTFIKIEGTLVFHYLFYCSLKPLNNLGQFRTSFGVGGVVDRF